jgi:phosphoglycolate phosphatase
MEDALAKEMVAKYRERYNIIGLFENEVYDGVTEALTELKKRGVILAVATSKPTEPTLKILDKFDLSQYFDVVCGSNPDGTGSEKKYIIQKVLNRLNTEYGRRPGGADSVKDSTGTDSVKEGIGTDSVKESSAGKGATDTAMVGDRYYDIEGGKACGLETIGVLYGYGNRKELEEAGATHIVELLPDIMNI